YEVLKFNRDDLTFLGQHKGFPPKRDPDENAILYALSDGSIAWVPNTLPIEILPAEGSHLTSTEIVKIIGEAKEPIVPHPSDSWYLHSIGETGELPDIIQASPEERKSLARYLLNELMEDRRFTQLIEIDVSAFQPYISQIVEWKEDRLNLLREMDWQNFWKIMYGLPDSSVQKIAKKLGTKKKLKNSDKNYIQLLIGAGTTLALETLGELARKHSLASELCSDFLLEVLESGPAIPRVSRTSHDIIAYPDTENENQEGIFYPLRHSEYLPEKFGWTCRSSMGHILSIDLELLKVNSLMSSSLKLHHWFLSTGEECCDESICTYYAYRNIKGSHQLIQLIADLASANPKERPEQTDCEGSETEDRQTKKYKIVLESHIPDRPWKVKTLGKLGGYPDWWQSPEIPSCPDCGRMMFYIGYVKADSIRDDMIDAALYGFHCEDCGIGAQVVQIT
ncbi:MAG: hypothetical protein KDK45_13985, partial [Leptospiraceae bacterium]|nr:hypothetical protein [Leptospiraceae bacterium]